MKPLLELHDLGKVYRGGVATRALEGVSFAVAPGEFVALVGASGSGKTTLLNLVGLLDTPTEGRLLLAGRDVTGANEDTRAELRRDLLGFVFQFHYLLPEFDALENALMPLRIRGAAAEAAGRTRIRALLEQIGLGLVVSVLASLVNLGVALLLRQVAHQRNSITLEANAQHLLTDVWTSAGVLLGVGAVALTGWQRLDPIVALLVAANIVWTGVGIVRRSTAGLMDAALSPADQAVVSKALQIHESGGVRFEALQTRQSGAYKFVSLHVLVPGEWTARRSHQLLDLIESDIRQALPGASVITHLGSLDAPGPVTEEVPTRKGTL